MCASFRVCVCVCACVCVCVGGGGGRSYDFSVRRAQFCRARFRRASCLCISAYFFPRRLAFASSCTRTRSPAPLCAPAFLIPTPPRPTVQVMRHAEGSVLTVLDASGAAEFVPRVVESKNVRKDRGSKAGGSIREQEEQAYLEKLSKELAAKKAGTHSAARGGGPVCLRALATCRGEAPC
jgi:hypothetical protein